MMAADQTVTTCASFLVELLRKRRERKEQKKFKLCACPCHSGPNSPQERSRGAESYHVRTSPDVKCVCKKKCALKSRPCDCGKPETRPGQARVTIVHFQLGSSPPAIVDTTYHPPMNKLFQGVWDAASSGAYHLPVCTCDKIHTSRALCRKLHGSPCTRSLCISVNSSSICKSCRLREGRPNSFDERPEGFLSRPDERLISTNASREDADFSRTSSLPENGARPKSFYEWTIPFEDIELGDCVAASPKGPVFKGRWHGEVMVHTRSHHSEQEIEEFQNEVAMLGLIRHENVVLFMGACIDPPNLAIVTSVRKGKSLHTHLHMRRTAFHFGSMFTIAKQIAQGMGYLHAKGITLGKLCSQNVFLESKVKIAITDYTCVDSPSVKDNYGCVPKGYLTYLGPELMRSLHIDGKFLSFSGKASQKADVYAYGTLIYEIFIGTYPFKDVVPESVIWQVANGTAPSLDGVEFPHMFKGILQSCWSSEPQSRPEFQEILAAIRKLHVPQSLQRQLSLSESDAINRLHNFQATLGRLKCAS